MMNLEQNIFLCQSISSEQLLSVCVSMVATHVWLYICYVVVPMNYVMSILLCIYACSCIKLIMSMS